MSDQSDVEALREKIQHLIDTEQKEPVSAWEDKQTFGNWATDEEKKAITAEKEAETRQFEDEKQRVQEMSEKFNAGVKASKFGAVEVTKLPTSVATEEEPLDSDQKMYEKEDGAAAFNQKEHDERYPIDSYQAMFKKEDDYKFGKEMTKFTGKIIEEAPVHKGEPVNLDAEVDAAFDTREAGRERTGTRDALFQGGLIPQDEHDAKVDAAVQEVIFDDNPWESVKKALRDRGFDLLPVEYRPQALEKIYSLRNEMNQYRYALEGLVEKTLTLTAAADILFDGLHVEEGEADAIRALVAQVNSESNRTLGQFARKAD